MTSFDMIYNVWNPLEKFNINFTETAPFNDNFNTVGFGSIGFFDALGSFAVIIILIIIGQILTPIISYLLSKVCLHSKFMKAIRKMEMLQ
jgi:hypothetical protein